MSKILCAGYLLFVIVAALLSQEFASNVTILPGSSAPNELRLRVLDANGPNYVAIRAPSSLAANYTIIPPTAWTDNSVLKSSTSGQLTFGTLGTDQLALHAVTALKIANNNVGTSQLDDQSAGTTQLTDDNLVFAKFSAAPRLDQYTISISDSQGQDLPASFNVAMWGNNSRALSTHLISASCSSGTGTPHVSLVNACTGGQMFAASNYLTCNGVETNVASDQTTYWGGCYMNLTIATSPAGTKDLSVTVKYSVD